MVISHHLPCPSIKRWEEAGASLVAAFKDYMDLCLDLGTGSLCEGAKPEDISSRIDSTLKTVHTVISHHLDESRAALARTRNRLSSPLFRFPEEILCEIFMNVVFHRNSQGAAKPPSMKQDVLDIYHNLYNVLGVCSTWRDIVLDRQVLWSMIPMVTAPSIKKEGPWQLILQRAGRSALHLAVDSRTSSMAKDLYKVLDDHGPYLSTINLSISGRQMFRDTITKLLKRSNPGIVSELSIQFNDVFYSGSQLPEESDYIFPRASRQWVSFIKLVGTPSSLRLSGTHFHWDIMTFSTQLVELRIDTITLGYDDDIVPFLRSLASASGLRHLMIIAVSTIRRPNATPDMDAFLPVVFPSLQSLYLRDLYFNTLASLLPMVAPGSHHLTLFLEANSLEINIPEDGADDDDDDESDETPAPEFADIDDLCKVLERIPAHSLILSGHRDESWLTGPMLHKLLKALPDMKTLTMHNWNLDKSTWKALTRFNNTQIQSQDLCMFPALETLHLFTATIHSKKGFHDMVASHPLREFVLGAEFETIHPGGTHRREPLQENSSIFHWLQPNVPVLRLVASTYRPRDFYLNKWQLW